jgi:hypothetical protein
MAKKKSDPARQAAKTASPKAVKKSKKLAAPAEAVAGATAKPAKPKSAPAKKLARPARGFTDSDISLRAYFIAERRQKLGWSGDSTSDWVEAERQLTIETKKKK